jgi:actin-related protein
VHFSKESNKKKRTISHISSTVPKVAGSTLRLNERKAIAREHSRIKRLVVSPHQKFGSSSGHRDGDGLAQPALQNYTTEELFRLRDEQEKHDREKSVYYASRLRKRSPKKYQSGTEFLSPVIKQKDRYREFFKTSKLPSCQKPRKIAKRNMTCNPKSTHSSNN